MSLYSKEVRKKIFEEELESLHKDKRLTYENYIELKKRYQNYYQKLELKETSQAIRPVVKEEKPIVKPEPVRPKKVLTEQEVREKNITWTLILGVILLLIGGLVFATNNWEDMEPFAKTLYVAIFSGVFFGMSYVAGRMFHVAKTSFAFLVLGSLFLPIILLTAGYFELFGTWYSLQGEGKYLFALSGSAICLPIYLQIAKRYQSRLFVWFSYLSLSLLVGFLLASMRLPIDAFYLGIALYNGLLLVFYHRKKKEKNLQLFMAELTVFAQTNLIISTLLMLMFFEHETFYSFNVILTALLYLFMIFMSQKKEYHFIFSALIVYGLYQLTQHSFLQTIDLIILSLIGYLFIALEQTFKKEVYLEKAFRYTSAIISFFAFIYISVQGIFIRLDESSILLFFGYVFVAINYLYLTYQTKNKLFSYLSVIFLTIAGYQSGQVIEQYTRFSLGVLYLFFIGFVLYQGLYYSNRYLYTKDVKHSAYFVSNIVLFIALLTGVMTEQWWEAVLMFTFFAFVHYRTFKVHENHLVKEITKWLTPICVLFALICTYPIITVSNDDYTNVIGFIGHTAISVILVYLLSYIIKEKDIVQAFIWISFISYAMALFASLPFNAPSMNETVLQPLLFFVGVGLFTTAIIKLKQSSLWIVTSLAFISGLVLLVQQTFAPVYPMIDATFFIIVGAIHLISHKFFEKIDLKARPYFLTVANVYLLYLFPIIVSTAFEVWMNFILFIIVALYNLNIAKKPWSKMLFIYFGFVSSLVLFNSVIVDVHWNLKTILFKLSILLVSSIAYFLWHKLGESWKPYLKWYLIPHSFFFLMVSLFDINNGWVDIMIMLSLIVLTIRILYQTNAMKLTFVPLFAFFVYAQENIWQITDNDGLQFAIWIGLFFLLKQLGRKFTPYLFSWKSGKSVDWFSLTALAFALTLGGEYAFFLQDQPILIQLIPTFLVTYWLYSQVNRTKGENIQKIVMTLTSFGVMVMYYQFVNHFNVPPILETEVSVLPWIILTWYLSNKTWKNAPVSMGYIQWFVLIITSWFLLQDTIGNANIMEPILLGVIAASYLIFGFQKQIKSFFLVGILLSFLNLILQTEPLWSAMPWWAYLLIIGTTLISFASYHEWSKQKGESEDTFKKKATLWFERFKQWK